MKEKSMPPIKRNFANWEDKKTRINGLPNTFRFGIVSDTHLSSKYQQISFLRWFYAYIKRQGAKFVLHSGDITDGEHIYRGQQYEDFNHGLDQQLAYAVDQYPNCLPTYLIAGN